MEHYIEVIGESSYAKTVEEYVADINISVRAVKAETAFDEVISLRNRCIETLLSSGLERSELQEAGAEAWQSWNQRNKPGQEAYQKIIISSQSMSRLTKALSAMEKLFDNQRYKFSLNMRQPIFGTNEENRNKARSEARKNAYAHAMILAEASNLKLDGTIQIQEIRPETESSGVYGDYSWGMGMLPAPSGSSGSYNGDNEYSNLDSANQIIKLKYKVRYSVINV